MTVVVFTGTQTFNRPADWNDANNFVYNIGGGAGGQTWLGYGGGGGACAIGHNVTMPSSLTVTIGAGGTPGSGGGATYFGGLVIATGGGIPAGGAAGGCTYNYAAYSGGSGGIGGTDYPGGVGGGGGGGGAASPGGGGSDGAASSGGVGGNGGNSPTASGGGGGFSSTGANGNNGSDFGANGGGGSGGGGGGGPGGYSGGHGGFYGGGGGGGGYSGGGGGYGRSGLSYVVYTPAVPTVTSCSPSGGSVAGGTPVTITGTNFSGATGATFGGNAATSFSVVNSTTITCVAPASTGGALGLVSVVVTGPGGSGSNNVYRYGYEPLPTRKDLALSPTAPTVTQLKTAWYPPSKDLLFSSVAPVAAIVAVSPNFNVGQGNQALSTTVPSVVNTASRNIEIGQANLFTSLDNPIAIRTIRDPAFDLGAQLYLSPTVPTVKVTTESIPIVIVEYDPNDPITILI